MTKPSAIQATYADMKLVRTRSCAQLVFEIPIEQAPAAIEAFGVPLPGKEVWCAIARLDTTKAASESEKPAKKWDELPLPQQAAMRCSEKPFLGFLLDTVARDKGALDANSAADVVRRHCGVTSRADIGKTEASALAWRKMDSDFRFWLRNV